VSQKLSECVARSVSARANFLKDLCLRISPSIVLTHVSTFESRAAQDDFFGETRDKRCSFEFL
jgi:hypothetical protein